MIFASIPTYLTSLGMIWYLVHLNELSPDPAWALTFGSILVFSTVYFLVRSGRTQHLDDPLIAYGHSLASLGLCTAAYMVLGPHRANVLILMAQSIVVAMLRLKPPDVLKLGVSAVLMLLGAFLCLIWQDPAGKFLSKGAPHIIVGSSSLLLLSLVGKWVSDIRVEIGKQAKELRNALLTVRQLATQDQLTGLLNRRVMLDKLEAERQISERHGMHWCVALIDLDHFKQVNDRYGHPAGDAVLKAFAELTRTQLRVVDQVGRWGGEEFLALFPQTCTDEALTSLERLRVALTEWRLPQHPELRMSFSAGLVQAAPDETLDQLVERADKTMYQAKAAGRNRCVWAPLVPPCQSEPDTEAPFVAAPTL